MSLNLDLAGNHGDGIHHRWGNPSSGLACSVPEAPTPS